MMGRKRCWGGAKGPMTTMEGVGVGMVEQQQKGMIVMMMMMTTTRRDAGW